MGLCWSEFRQVVIEGGEEVKVAVALYMAGEKNEQKYIHAA
jgi:hypothetical protein